ncbi:TolC family protein [Vulgatibacter incomptus]|uniref:Heavy metal RND efflux outer membrane protein, CzcC family n=1 Tax=Vulgatibacter incomptus TaxID=1391653 RepID=A0A0K1P9L4_9BACT|nr:TolC family protein [Vulgatibacter incomptus]AKU90126.1 Heavy metal RND efflux outer membrane protein, CzcC family [Vulgatibacter incomptus]
MTFRISTLLAPALLLAAAPARGDLPAERAPAAAFLRDDAALIEWVRTRSPEVAAAQSRVDQAQAGVGSARLFPNPSLDATMGNVNVGSSAQTDVRGADRLSWGVGISQELELGKRGPRIDAADLSAQASREELRASLAERVADARVAIGEAVRLQVRQTILEESLTESRDHLALEKVRLQHGDLSGIDYDRLVLDALGQEADVRRNRAELESALASCAAILLAPCETGEAGPDDLDAAATVPAEIADPEEALRERPDYRAILLGRSAAQKEATLARRRAIPDPTLSVSYSHDLFNELTDTVQFGVGIPLPLFDRGQHDAALATAKARELDRTAAGTIQQGLGEVRGLAAQRRTLEETLSRLDEEALPLSNGILETARKAFAQGEYSLTDLLLARRENTELRLQVLDLRGELFTVRNDLRKALGLDAAAARSAP